MAVKDLILETHVKNSLFGVNGKVVDQPNTIDKLYLPDFAQVGMGNRCATDFAIATGVKTYMGNLGSYMSRLSRKVGMITVRDDVGTREVSNDLTQLFGIIPAMHIKPEAKSMVVSLAGELHKGVKLGVFPQSFVGAGLNRTLNANINNPAVLRPTGGTYGFSTKYNEYEYKGERYVCVPPRKIINKDTTYKFYDTPFLEGADWFKVEPIAWVVKNWHKIKGQQVDQIKYLSLEAQNILIGGIHYGEKNGAYLWNGSIVGDYLNGTNYSKMNLSNASFIEQALNVELDGKRQANNSVIDIEAQRLALLYDSDNAPFEIADFNPDVIPRPAQASDYVIACDEGRGLRFAEYWVCNEAYNRDSKCNYFSIDKYRSISVDQPLNIRAQLNIPLDVLEKNGELFCVGRDLLELQAGRYPQVIVDSEMAQQLTGLLEQNLLTKTGKVYIREITKHAISYVQEYNYCGKNYVCLENGNTETEYSDGKTHRESQLWFEVTPINWVHKYYLQDNTERVISKFEMMQVVIPQCIYYPYPGDKGAGLFENSTAYAYLNGKNVNKIEQDADGNIITNLRGGDFTSRNFIKEAFETGRAYEKISNKKKIKRSYRVQETPMNVSQQIEFYINKGKSFMLHGPSGVGKSRRIESVDPDFTSIILRNGILPEEIIGKTIYPNLKTVKNGTWVPPEWYVKLCEKCKAEPDKNHVLFIDELTNVRPTEQSLVFHLVLNKMIAPNLGKLPENVVVVAAGNSPEESEAAYNMPEPLYRRFEGHITLKPNVEDFLEWGAMTEENASHQRIHPLIMSFVAAYGENVLFTSYDNEGINQDFAIDPRGWEQVSNLIYDNDELIVPELLQNKLGQNITASLLEFAREHFLSIEDILEDNYSAEELPQKIDSQYALIYNLKNADFTQVKKIRQFIGENLGEELLAKFDLVWANQSDENALYLNQLQCSSQELER